MIGDLLEGHEALGLEANIDDEELLSLFNNLACNDFVAVSLDSGGLGGLLAFEGLEGRGEIFSFKWGRGLENGDRSQRGGNRFCFGYLVLCHGFRFGGLVLCHGLSHGGRSDLERGFNRQGKGIGVQCGYFDGVGGLGSGRGFGQRLLKLRRRFKRWGFEFGVQGYALGFGIEDVCHL
jgi:hypothetical protein